MRKLISVVLVLSILFSNPLLICAAEASTGTDAVKNFGSLNDPELVNYLEYTVYQDLIDDIDNDNYYVENVEAIYISKEYLEEAAYNSQANIYFGYTLAELEEQFQGTPYIFTLGDDGTTIVKEFEAYDGTYQQALKNVAIGSGVIFLCVTVAAATGGIAPAVSMIFMVSAQTGATMALSGGVISGAAAGIVSAIQGNDTEQILKDAALAGSEGFKWGAIAGAVNGGVKEYIGLKDATLNGLTMDQAAKIQRARKLPLDVIRNLQTEDQYKILEEIDAHPAQVNGRTVILRHLEITQSDIDLMKDGKAPICPDGNACELHHLVQKTDSTLAILSETEHRSADNYKVWHKFTESEIDRAAFDKERAQLWKEIARMYEAGLITF